LNDAFLTTIDEIRDLNITFYNNIFFGKHITVYYLHL